MTICFIYSAYCLSARSGTRTLRLMICSLGQKKWSRGSRQCECWEPRLFCNGGLLSGYSLEIAGVRVQVYSDADEKTLCALVEETKLNRKELLQNQIWALKFMTALPEINWRENTFQDYWGLCQWLSLQLLTKLGHYQVRQISASGSCKHSAYANE